MRALVWPVVEALKQGEPEGELLKHYPALTREKLEAAKLYAEVHPRRSVCNMLRQNPAAS